MIFSGTKNIYCVGRNYVGHIKELKSKKPTKPVFFYKPLLCLNTSNKIVIPKNREVEHELEVVVLIKKNGVAKNEKQAKSFIGGYTLGIDITDRKLQNQLKKESTPWFLSKSFNGSAVVSKNVKRKLGDEFYLKTNGEIKQSGKTSNMIFSIERLIVYLSSFINLQKNDLIFTGTPLGVGALKKNDVVEIGFSDSNDFEKYIIS